MQGPERGAALLEVMAAVTILAFAGVSAIELMSGGTRAVAIARGRERELADEERLLTAYVLLDASDLNQRLGTREVGPYIVIVQRPAPALFRIALTRASNPGVEDLMTVVYRPERTGAP